MSKVDLTLYSVLILFSILGATLLYKTFSTHDSVDVNAGAPSAREGYLYNLHNDVRLKRPTDIAWKELLDEFGLDYGSQIFVGKNSTAWIRTKTFQAHIEENSLFYLSKQKLDSALTFEKGTIQIQLSEAKPVFITVGGKTVEMKGDSKILLNRNGDAKDSNLGVSVLEGTANISTSSGQVISTKAGQSFEIKSAGKNRDMTVESLTIELLTEKREVPFFENQQVQFHWKAPLQKFKTSEFQLSETKNFTKIIFSQLVKKDSLFIEKLIPGKYYWRLRADTGTAEIFSALQMIDILSEIPAQQLTPFFKFEKPTEWAVDFSAQANPYAQEYQFELAQDENFKKSLLFKNSKELKTQSSLTYIGPVYTRTRYKYKGLDNVSAWSPVQFIKTLTVQGTPELIIQEPQGSKVSTLSWNLILNSEFYKLFQFDALTNKAEGSRDIFSTSTTVQMQHRRQIALQVRSHKSSAEFGFDSNKIVLKGFVDSPQFSKISMTPKWLPRFAENQLPKINLHLNADLQSEETILLEISENADFKNAIQITGRPNQFDFETEVPIWKKYYLRSKINVDDRKLLTSPSEVSSASYPAVPMLPTVQLNLPRQNEDIFNASPNFFMHFYWSNTSENLFFDLSIAEDIDFKKIIHHVEVSASEYILKQKLKDGKYFWRVRSYNKFIESSWSEPRAFGIINAVK